MQKLCINIRIDQSYSDRRVLLEKWEENARYLYMKKYGSVLYSAREQTGSQGNISPPVTLNSEMDFYLRNGRNGDFFYEMEYQNSILFII